MSTQVAEMWIPTTETFAARLALIRWRMGWNMKEAALACGFPQQVWRGWELHNRSPRHFAEIAQQISERTGVDDYWIMTGKQNAPRPDGPEGIHDGVRPKGFEPPTF
ncbi:helix-turn-helix domain-containing protein [Tersicoccus sp. Bi-70]|uniref:helix-turn-helix domain-containing protein n=1 Tax=Tersicoccus sp. Bi-70 TaxID=1897634 RepID=UPI00117DB357|nr:helix-turn-helix transcriptional regulator [Tersicoccus sp. Bi-70]